MRRRSTLLILTALLIAGIGCGASDEERVEGAFKEWLMANTENDHERVCGLMTTNHRSENHPSRQTSVADCLTEQRRRATPATPRQQRAVAEVQIANVAIKGDTATAYLRLRGCTLSHTWSRFRRAANGEWRFDGSMPAHGFGPRCLR